MFEILYVVKAFWISGREERRTLASRRVFLSGHITGKTNILFVFPLWEWHLLFLDIISKYMKFLLKRSNAALRQITIYS